jgi:SAM-dependent methyltransferase
MSVDFTSVTETPGTMVSKQALDMAWTRYAFAKRYCERKSVLEVACGPGPGLGCLSETARSLVAGDYTMAHLLQAKRHYGERVPLIRLDGLQLPFRPGTFEVVLLFEALYFLPSFDKFAEASWDVLGKEGVLIIATVNPEWTDFNPAPFSTRYLTASELTRSLETRGFKVNLFTGFPSDDPTARGRMLGAAKRAAVKLHLIPKTMKGKERLKRLVFGRLSRFPAEVTHNTGQFHEPHALVDLREMQRYKIIYAVARKDKN